MVRLFRRVWTWYFRADRHGPRVFAGPGNLKVRLFGTIGDAAGDGEAMGSNLPHLWLGKIDEKTKRAHRNRAVVSWPRCRCFSNPGEGYVGGDRWHDIISAAGSCIPVTLGDGWVTTNTIALPPATRCSRPARGPSRMASLRGCPTRRTAPGRFIPRPKREPVMWRRAICAPVSFHSPCS